MRIFFSLILIFAPLKESFANEEKLKSSTYYSGREICQELAQKEKGQWIKVPIDPQNPSSTFELYYWVLGQKFDSAKPTMVFVEGGPAMTSHDYSFYFDEFVASGINVVLFDQRGYVCSRPEEEKKQADPAFYSFAQTAHDMEALRKHLGVEKWHVYGQSFGSPISVTYASLFPERVRQLILDGPADLIPPDEALYAIYHSRLIGKFQELLGPEKKDCIPLMDENLRHFIKEIMSVNGHAGLRDLIDLMQKKQRMPTENEVDQLYEKTFASIPKGQWAQQGYQQEYRNTEIIADKEVGDPQNHFDARKLKNIVPTTFLLGEFDGTPLEEIQTVRKFFKKSRLITIHNGGHGAVSDVFHQASPLVREQLKKVLLEILLKEEWYSPLKFPEDSLAPHELLLSLK
jgi:pimeloyl-ACP methyl ester carboxylesterase